MLVPSQNTHIGLFLFVLFQGDPAQLGEEPALPPFTPIPMPAELSAVTDYSPLRPLARGHVVRPMVELDMDSEDYDTTEPDSNETQICGDQDMHFG